MTRQPEQGELFCPACHPRPADPRTWRAAVAWPAVWPPGRSGDRQGRRARLPAAGAGRPAPAQAGRQAGEAGPAPHPASGPPTGRRRPMSAAVREAIRHLDGRWVRLWLRGGSGPPAGIVRLRTDDAGSCWSGPGARCSRWSMGPWPTGAGWSCRPMGSSDGAAWPRMAAAAAPQSRPAPGTLQGPSRGSGATPPSRCRPQTGHLPLGASGQAVSRSQTRVVSTT